MGEAPPPGHARDGRANADGAGQPPTSAAPYGEDLAAVHEAGFSDLARAAARMLRELVPAPAFIVDLGCGGGTLAEELLRHGYSVHGIDASPAMVALARQRLERRAHGWQQAHATQTSRAAFEVADALDVPVPACDAVTAVGEVLNYALATRRPDDAGAFFRRVHDALKPGGVFLFDCATTAKQPGARTATRDGRGWRVEARVVVDGDRLTRTIDTWRTPPHGGPERHSREVHLQRLVATEWVVERLGAAGFTVELLGGYDDFAFQAGWDGFLARPGRPP